jgi:RNA polymerase-binding transcription factor DksA
MSRGGREDNPTSGSGEGDEIDRANALSQLFLDSALNDALARAKPQQVPGADGEYPFPDCVDCGDPIPPIRLQWGRIRCVECQTRVERWALH